jgi:hypothetical protein
MDTYDAAHKRRQARSKELDEGDKKEREETKAAAKRKKLENALASGTDDDVKAALASMSLADLKETPALKEGKPGIERIAKAMSTSKFKEVMDDLSISTSTREKMKSARYRALESDAEDAIRAATGPTPDWDKLEKFMKDTDIADLKELRQFKAGGAELQIMASTMPSSKFKQFNEDQSIDSVTKNRVRTARYEGPQGLKTKMEIAADTGRSASEVAQAREDLSRWSAEEFETSGVLADPALRAKAMQVISDEQYRAIQSSGSIGTTTKSTLEKLREDHTDPNSRFSASNIDHTLSKIITKASDRAKLPGPILASREVRSRLVPADFVAIQKTGKLEEADRQMLATRVKALVRANDPVMAAQIGRLQGRELQRFKDFYNIP